MMRARFGATARGLATLGAAGLAVYRLALRSRQLRWGATDDEVAAALPGNDLLAGADLTATRTITVGCPPHAVWPWIAQLGQGRGGLWSDVLAGWREEGGREGGVRARRGASVVTLRAGRAAVASAGRAG
jgi:hypothetical protein